MRRFGSALFATAVVVGSVITGGLPATAAPSVGQPVVTAPATFARGGASASVTVSVPTTEDANFTLSVTAPQFTTVLPSSCSTNSAGVSCTITSGSVVIGNNEPTNDPANPPDEPVTAFFNVSASANADIDLTST